jgi:hypothetical protein
VRDIAVEIAGDVENAVLVRQMSRRVHGDCPVHELLAGTHEYAVIVDRVFVIHRKQQFAVEPVNGPRIGHQHIVDRLPVSQFGYGPLKLFLSHAPPRCWVGARSPARRAPDPGRPP